MLSDAEMDRRWADMRDAMVLAIEEVMVNSEFKEKYRAALALHVSARHQNIADKILNVQPKYGPPDPDIPAQPQE